MVITRKNIRSTAQFFPTLYTLTDYSDGFEVISHKKGEGCSIYFWNDSGPIQRTDIPWIVSKRLSVKEAAKLLWMSQEPTPHPAA